MSPRADFSWRRHFNVTPTDVVRQLLLLQRLAYGRSAPEELVLERLLTD